MARARRSRRSRKRRKAVASTRRAKLPELLQLVEVADGAAVAVGGYGEVAPKLAPDVDDERGRSAALDRLQLARRRHLAAQRGIDGSAVADEIRGGGQTRAPVGRQQLQDRAADAGARQQGLRSSREPEGQTGAAAGRDGQGARLCRLRVTPIDEHGGEGSDGRGRETQSSRA